MKNDLTVYERNLLIAINMKNSTKYTHKNFMEWCTSKELAESSLRDGEVLHEVAGVYVAIKPEA